ncbi:Do family serine endopeptidase [Sphingosinicella sp. LHD-64]|uniref:Do family serine endopeptidase n=1 Tax=Sphingosinicella sp. LHD-64 TaxID=3072139 RepID=UPI00280DDC82|nr:Do family serine endopeptidase [Sphingosinicella sp. LHD-64]MDQ8756166.1 Do family serine endopeptidase [Sphingosinicella sp. LHD-64]
MRYVYGITAAVLLGGAAATLTLNPVGAQTAQNEPGAITVPRPNGAPGFADMVERLQPAVVNISTRQSVQVQQRRLPPGFEEFFRRFGAPVPDGGQGQGQGQGQGDGTVTQRGGSLGSGFIISADGYIVTNNHVVAPARPDAVVEQITVTLSDRTEYEAEVVGRDQVADIAVLKVNPRQPLPFVRFGDSTRTRVGDWVVAIGNPFGLGGTVTAGIVSALHRNIGAGLYDRYIQTDASINSGNSGGPMFDLGGNVIGINTALISPTGGNVGIGFAIPAEQVRPIVEQLRRGERVRRGYIGIAMQDVDEGVASALGIERNRGTLIRSITPGGPAERAGLRQGDVIVAVAGQPVTQDQTLGYLVAQQQVGARVPFEYIREGQRRTANVTIAERPTEEELARLGGAEPEEDSADAAGKPGADQPVAGQETARASLGLTLQPLTPATARRLQITDPSVRGLVVTAVDPNSDAGQKGLQPGDLVLSVNQQATTTAEQVNSIVAAARRTGRDTVLLLVRRGNAPPIYIGVELARARQ